MGQKFQCAKCEYQATQKSSLVHMGQIEAKVLNVIFYFQISIFMPSDSLIKIVGVCSVL